MVQASHEKELINVTKRKYSTVQTNGIELLKSQHREVENLFEKFEASGKKAYKKKQKIFQEIAVKLGAHAVIEESYLYKEAKSIDPILTLEAYEEHDIMKDLIDKILTTDSSDETFDAKVIVLKEIVEHHVKEEEKEYFPKIKKSLDKEVLLELGDEMKREFEILVEANSL